MKNTSAVGHGLYVCGCAIALYEIAYEEVKGVHRDPRVPDGTGMALAEWI